MLRRLPTLVAAMALLPVLGCSEAHDDTVVDGANELGKRVGVDQLPTTEANVAILDGYDALLDTRLGACVRSVGQAQPIVGQVTQETTIQLVRNEQELTRDLGVDATLTVKIPLGSVNGAASIVRSFKSSSQHVNYLIQSKQSYRVANTAPVELTDSALDALRSDPTAFFMRCGDRYVSDVTYEAKIVALLTFETDSEETAASIQGELGGGGSAGPAQVNATVKGRLSDLAKRTDVSALMHVVAQGFDVPSNDALFGLGGTVDEKLARMDALAGKLGESLRGDRERDANGYTTNRMRNAIPAFVGLARYGYADNAPGGLDASEAFRAHRENQTGAETYLRALAGLKLGMERAYTDELFPFLVADADQESSFNLMPPATPKRFGHELRAIATAWAERFQEGGDLPGASDLVAVTSALGACADDARYGVYTACHVGEDVTRVPAYASARAALDEYVQNGRIGKLRVATSSPNEVSYDVATSRCAAAQGRLPTPDEARVLAPLVAGAHGGPNHSIWTTDSPRCRLAAGEFPSFANTMSSFGPRCERRGFFSEVRNGLICVPTSGPLAKPATL